jgi:hypothetical protein
VMTRRLIVTLASGMLACTALLVVSFSFPSAQAATKFGSDLKNRHGSVIWPNHLVRSCRDDGFWPLLDASKPCDRIAVRFLATGSGGNKKAPKTGTIKALRLVAWTSGSFRFELARVKGFHADCGGRRCEGKARIVHRGPKIHYESSVDGDDYRIQTFRVRQHVHKGEYLGIRARRESLLNCRRGGAIEAEQLLFQPVLPVGGRFKHRDSYGECTLLLQAVYKKR